MQPLIFPRHNFTGDVFSATCWFVVLSTSGNSLGDDDSIKCMLSGWHSQAFSLLRSSLKIVESISACTLCVRQKRLFRPVSLDFILRAPSFSLAGAAQLPILIEWRRALSAARYSLKAARMWCGHYFLCDSLSHFLDCVWVRECVFCRLACSIHFEADRQLDLGPTAIKCGANEIAISANFSNCAHLLFEKRSLWGSPCDSDCEISVFYVVNFNFSCLTWEQLNNLWKRHSWMTLQQLNKKIYQIDTLRYQKIYII